MAPIEALKEAIRVCGGTPATLADAIRGGEPIPASPASRVLRQHVENWLATGHVPAAHCPSIERETARRGRAVPCEQLNPLVDWAALRGARGRSRREAAIKAA